MLYYGGVVAMQFLAGGCWAMTGLGVFGVLPERAADAVRAAGGVPAVAGTVLLARAALLAEPAGLQDCLVELSYRDTLLAGLGVFGGLSVILGAAFAARAARRLRYG